MRTSPEIMAASIELLERLTTVLAGVDDAATAATPWPTGPGEVVLTE